MPTPPSVFSLVERTDFLLRVIRARSHSGGLQIEALQEISVPGSVDLAAQAETIRALAAEGELIAAVRPKARLLHLSSAEEAARHAGIAGARQFVSHPPANRSPAAWSACGPASIGDSDTRWIAEALAPEAMSETQAALEGAGLKPKQWYSSTLAQIGAICATASAPTCVLDIGEAESYAILIAKGGVRGIGIVSLNLDRIADAVQTQLGLKFRGSAAKLFFNDQYDFTDAAPAIAEKLAASLRSELGALAGKQDPIAQLVCPSLSAKQQWLATQLGATLRFEPSTFDIKTWCTSAKLTCAAPESEAILSPSWLGSLQLLAARAGNTAAARWQVEWTRLRAANGTTVETTPTPIAKIPTKSGDTAAKAAPSPAVNGASATAKSGAAAVVIRNDAPRALPPLSVIIDTPPAPATVAKGPAAAGHISAGASARNGSRFAGTDTAVATESSVQYPPRASATSRQSPPPASPRAVPPSAAAPRHNDDTEGTQPRKSKTPLVLMAVAACAAIGIGAYVYTYIQGQKAEAARLVAEKAQVEARARAEAERAHAAEEQARAETERRKQFELDSLKKLASSEAARQQAEQEAKAQTAARLANARGMLEISSDPAGANVSIDDVASQTTPAIFATLRIGHYKVGLSHPLCEPKTIEVDIAENATTNAGVIRLTRTVGSLTITSDPSGLRFDLAPAKALLITNAERRSGTTPATFSDLAPGDYAVNFMSDTPAPHHEVITVAANKTAQTSWTVASGVVQIASVPSGAAVLRNGVKIGVTPLTLTDEAPGNVSFDLTLPAHTPAHVSGTVERGQVLVMSRTLDSLEHIASLNELDQLPVPIEKPAPTFMREDDRPNGSVILNLIVGRDGKPRSIEVLKSSDRMLTDACLEAVAHWKFKPGMIAGQPVNCRVQLPFTFSGQ